MVIDVDSVFGARSEIRAVEVALSLSRKSNRPDRAIDDRRDGHHLRLGLVSEHLKEELRMRREVERLGTDGQHFIEIAFWLIAAGEAGG